MASEQPERSQFTPTDDAAGMLHDAIDWGRLADIDAARRILLRVAGTGERGHLPLTAEQAATFVVDAIAEQIHARGIAEGLRQATEGWEREWGVEHQPLFGDETSVEYCEDAELAHHVQLRTSASRVVSRLVGPWEPAPSAESEGADCD